MSSVNKPQVAVSGQEHQPPMGHIQVTTPATQGLCDIQRATVELLSHFERNRYKELRARLWREEVSPFSRPQESRPYHRARAPLRASCPSLETRHNRINGHPKIIIATRPLLLRQDNHITACKSSGELAVLVKRFQRIMPVLHRIECDRQAAQTCNHNMLRIGRLWRMPHRFHRCRRISLDSNPQSTAVRAILQSIRAR